MENLSIYGDGNGYAVEFNPVEGCDDSYRDDVVIVQNISWRSKINGDIKKMYELLLFTCLSLFRAGYKRLELILFSGEAVYIKVTYDNYISEIKNVLGECLEADSHMACRSGLNMMESDIGCAFSMLSDIIDTERRYSVIFTVTDSFNNITGSNITIDGVSNIRKLYFINYSAYSNINMYNNGLKMMHRVMRLFNPSDCTALSNITYHCICDIIKKNVPFVTIRGRILYMGETLYLRDKIGRLKDIETEPYPKSISSRMMMTRRIRYGIMFNRIKYMLQNRYNYFGRIQYANNKDIKYVMDELRELEGRMRCTLDTLGKVLSARRERERLRRDLKYVHNMMNCINEMLERPGGLMRLVLNINCVEDDNIMSVDVGDDVKRLSVDSKIYSSEYTRHRGMIRLTVKDIISGGVRAIYMKRIPCSGYDSLVDSVEGYPVVRVLNKTSDPSMCDVILVNSRIMIKNKVAASLPYHQNNTYIPIKTDMMFLHKMELIKERISHIVAGDIHSYNPEYIHVYSSILEKMIKDTLASSSETLDVTGVCRLLNTYRIMYYREYDRKSRVNTILEIAQGRSYGERLGSMFKVISIVMITSDVDMNSARLRYNKIKGSSMNVSDFRLHMLLMVLRQGIEYSCNYSTLDVIFEPDMWNMKRARITIKDLTSPSDKVYNLVNMINMSDMNMMVHFMFNMNDILRRDECLWTIDNDPRARVVIGKDIGFSTKNMEKIMRSLYMSILEVAVFKSKCSKVRDHATVLMHVKLNIDKIMKGRTLR